MARHGVKFIHAAVESSAKNAAWVDLSAGLARQKS